MRKSGKDRCMAYPFLIIQERSAASWYCLQKKDVDISTTCEYNAKEVEVSTTTMGGTHAGKIWNVYDTDQQD